MFGQLTGGSVIGAAAFLPIAVQEMVFAVWLIGKGFNPPAVVEPPLLRRGVTAWVVQRTRRNHKGKGVLCLRP